ncbi:MAG: PQQ-binding-like beta-propeller repeat protein [Sedimentisphaerales bacterium]|nr:PQQ-binding-like beta-propeller repeat protein [Sedimentisphaerales bacterium]
MKLFSRLLQVGLGVYLGAMPAMVRGMSNIEISAKNISESSGFTGGICVIIGDKTGDFATAVSQKGRYVVQVLLTEEGSLEKVRHTLRSGGIYGQVSAIKAEYDPLPYAENLINIIIIGDYESAVGQGLSMDEIFRVLTPFGSVYIDTSKRSTEWTGSLEEELLNSGFEQKRFAGGWLRAVKPWPKEIDEWTHYLHGADGNPVAQDRVVAPPKHFQWVSDPLWMRSHESDSSVRTLVTSHGRLFYIGDEAPISLVGDHDLPDKWFLTARDAFNGVELWKVPIKDWGWRSWKPSWFTPRPGGIPLNIEKRLVAVNDTVYVTLGYRAPVSQLDAKTGRLLETYDGTDRAAEILYRDGLLILSMLEGDRARVKIVDAESGKMRWSSEKAYRGTTTDYYRFRAMYGSVTPAKVDPTLNIATDGKVIALLDGEDVVGINFEDGKERWRGKFPLVKEDYKAGGINALQTVWTGTLIVSDDIVVHASPNQLAAFSAQTGKILWTQPKKYLGHLWYEWKDVFVIDRLVWTWSGQLAREPLVVNGQPSKGRSVWPVSANGYDLLTGKLRKEVPLGHIFKTHHHHRCYRNKATLRYILASRRGTEYVDLNEGHHTIQNWVRGTCHVGMMPANGLQYAPPHPCVCYIEEKLNGMLALAPQIPSCYRPVESKTTEQLERGSAYGQVRGPDAGMTDWPAYRHDALRSGSVGTRLPDSPQLLWNKKVGRKTAQPSAVDGRLFLSLVDEHCVAALKVEDGGKIWKFTAGGRIDSPPTYYRGAVIFGSADGSVYCVRADDGELVWRFRAAPRDRQIGAFGQLESAWPVHGGVLVRDGVAYFASGRSSHLDGGLTLYGVDALSGRIRHQTKLVGPHYDVENTSQNYQLPMGALPDILQSDGRLISMRHLTFNAELEEQKLPPKKTPLLITAKSGLLDGSYFKRTPWTYGQSGYARLLVHDDETTYCVRMFDSLRGLDPNVYFTPGKKGYLLFASDKTDGRQAWAGRIRVRINAMVVTENLLFIAGSPDVVDPKDPLGAFEGRKGGILAAMGRSDGKKIWEYALDAPPVYDGLVAASGRLYAALQNGCVVCFGP